MSRGTASTGISRRRLLQAAAGSTALAAFGTGTMISVSDAKAAALDAFGVAKVDWKTFAGTEIVLAALEHPWTAAVEPIIPLFTELTGVKIKLQKQSEAEYIASMPVKLGAGAPEPDVMMVHALGQFIAAGWLEPLDGHYSNKSLFDPGWYDLSDNFAMANDFTVWSDKVRYSQSITAEAQTLFANQNYLDAAGVALPKTFDELLAAALKMKTGGHAGIALRSKAAGSAAPWPAGGFVFSHGGQIVSSDGKAGLLDSPEAVAAIEVYSRLLREAGPMGAGSYDWYEVLTDFMSGSAAMGADSSNFATDIANPSKSKVSKAVYGQMPAAPGRKPVANIWTWQAGINSKSRKKGAAFLFLTFVNSKPGCALTSAAGLATPRNSAWASEGFQKRFGAEAAKAALLNLNSGDAALFKAAWFHPKSAQLLDAFAVGINEAATGVKAAKAAMIDANAKIDGLLKG